MQDVKAMAFLKQNKLRARTVDDQSSLCSTNTADIITVELREISKCFIAVILYMPTHST